MKLINTIEEIIRKQVVFDEHDDRVMALLSSIQCLLNHLSLSVVLLPKYTPVSVDRRSIATRRLHQIQDCLSVFSDNLSTTPTEDYEICQIRKEITDL